MTVRVNAICERSLLSYLTVIGILVVIIFYIVLTYRKPKFDNTAREMPLAARRQYTDEEARSLVFELIEMREKFVVESGIGDFELPSYLGPITREFFSKYRSVCKREGSFCLSVAQMKPSEYVPGYFSIGNFETWDVVQELGSDEVFVAEGGETSKRELERFENLYFLLINEAQDVG